MLHLRSLMAVAAIASGALFASADNAAANDCYCSCPPPPYCTTLCVSPPCSCCPQSVSVCVPGCCTAAPQVCWRAGLFGRQIGTYTWPCCGHAVKVVVTRRGEVRVRG